MRTSEMRADGIQQRAKRSNYTRNGSHAGTGGTRLRENGGDYPSGTVSGRGIEDTGRKHIGDNFYKSGSGRDGAAVSAAHGMHGTEQRLFFHLPCLIF